jgi:hypothetical protein
MTGPTNHAADTGLDPDAPPPYDPAEMGPRRRSALAVFSLVLSVLPVGSVVAPVLGAMALVRMRRDPRLDGAPLAWAGIVVGVVATTLMAGGAWMQWVAFQHVVEMPRLALEAAFRGDAEAFRAQMSKPGADARTADVRAFADALRERFGEFRGLRIGDQRLPKEAAPRSEREAPAPFTATFARGEVPVVVLYESVDGRAFGVGSMLVRRFTFAPPGGARIVFPDDEPAPPKQPDGTDRK